MVRRQCTISAYGANTLDRSWCRWSLPDIGEFTAQAVERRFQCILAVSFHNILPQQLTLLIHMETPRGRWLATTTYLTFYADVIDCAPHPDQ